MQRLRQLQGWGVVLWGWCNGRGAAGLGGGAVGVVQRSGGAAGLWGGAVGGVQRSGGLQGWGVALWGDTSLRSVGVGAPQGLLR